MFQRLLVALVLMFAHLASAGWSSNGADFTKDQNNPWFLGTDPVRYCLHRALDYPLTSVDLSALVAESFDQWKSFFRKYGLAEATIGDVRYRGRFPDGQSRSMALDFQEVANCAAENGDLEIHFGVRNRLIEGAIQQGYHHGAALAIRADFNHRTFRHGGHIWIDNFSSEREKVHHLLLHELGHVMGMKHDSVHVMDAKIADRLTRSSVALEGLGAIESEFWKYGLITNEAMTFFVSPATSNRSPEGVVSAKTVPPAMRRWLGLEEKHQFGAKLKYLRSSAPMKLHLYMLELEVEGETQVKKFNLQLDDPKESSPEAWAPGLYTRWRLPNGTESFFEQSFDLNIQPRSMAGSILMTGQNFAATLSFEKGVQLRIFEPTHGIWWELR